MNELLLRSESVSLRLTPLSEFPDDIDSVRCSVRWVATGIGDVQTESDFYWNDLLRFRNELADIYKNLKGLTELYAVEEDINILVSYSKHHIQISGFMTLTNVSGRLEFSFETDPSFLVSI